MDKINSFFLWTIIGFISIFIGSLACVASLFDKSGDLSHHCGRIWGRCICAITDVEVEVLGLRNLCTRTPQIFISNHQSFFDIFALTACLPVQFRFAAKESLFSIPFVGWGMRASGHISIDRENKKKSFNSFLDIIKTLKTGRSVFIFPEGTRGDGDKIGTFKKGSIILAKRSQVPIVPITISGSREVMKKDSLLIKPGKISIFIDKPIKTNYLMEEKVDDLLTAMKETITTKIKGCKS